MASLEKTEKIYNIHAKFYDLTRQSFLFNRKKALIIRGVNFDAFRLYPKYDKKGGNFKMTF